MAEPNDMVVLEILNKYKTFYRTISLAALREIALHPSLTERNARVWEASKPFAVDSDDQVEYTLVLDGSEDEESWGELFSND